MNESADRKLVTGLFFRLLPYQMLLIVISAVNGIVDSLFASNMVGNAAMSAIGLYSPLNHFLYAASMMLVSGSQLLYGRYLGKKPEAIRSVFSVDMIISAVLAAVVSLFLILCASLDLTKTLVAADAERRLLNQYILGQSAGIPALVMGQQLFAFLSLENRTRRTMAASIACFLSNTVMNYVFVGLLGLEALGLGLGSAAGLWVFFGVQAHYYFSGKSQMKFSLRAFRVRELGRIIRLGYPGAISRFVEMFRCIVVNFLVLNYVGSVGLSSFAASNSFLAIIWSLPFGMVAVARMLFSISMGEEDRRSLTDTMRVVFFRGMPLMMAVSVLLILCAKPITALFFRDPSDPVWHMTVMGFRIMPLCMPLAVVSLNFSCYAQAAEKKLLSILLPVVDGFAGVVLCSLILIPVMKMNGLYVSNVLNGVICLALVTVYAWIVMKRFPRTMDDLMTVRDGFGVPGDARLDMTVRHMDEVVDVSRRVTAFCRGRGIDERRASFAGLALEEMAGNIVSHGFEKDNKKNHSVDIRVVHKSDRVLLRIRDDCVPFDPSARARLLEDGDPFRNIGIRIVFGMAADIRYQNLLGLNVLTIII